MRRIFISTALFVLILTMSLTAMAAGSTTIVISQAYGGGGSASGTYIHDYVELKNVSSTPQSLGGLSLMYGSAAGQFGSSSTNIFALPSVTLNPGQYFLVELSSAGTGGAPLPSPDAVTTNLSMSGTSGKVALVTAAFTGNTCGATASPCPLPNANIIDLVSWGAANNAEGGAPTNGGSALTATQGNVRKAGGCTETDNNNADFDIITAPVPRNTGSTATPCGSTIHHANADFDGDGKTDVSVVRGTGSPLTGGVQRLTTNGEKLDLFRKNPEAVDLVPQETPVYWYNLASSNNAVSITQWGNADIDFLVPADFDGDGRSDIAVWRPGTAGTASFYIFQSATSTLRQVPFGETGTDVRVVADYDGDGKADPAGFGCPLVGSGQCLFAYMGSLNNPSGTVTYVPWGVGADGDYVAYPGNFDGDTKADFCVLRAKPGAPTQGQFALLKSNGFTTEFIDWGLVTDTVIPGDYDGDGKTDFMVSRLVSGSKNYYLYTRTGAASISVWGTTNDQFVPGDYDGDGKTDLAVWRGSVTPGQSAFYTYRSSTGTAEITAWGTCVGQCDVPTAGWQVH